MNDKKPGELPSVIDIQAQQSKQRLDKVLSLELPDISRTRIQQWLSKGWILVNGAVVTQRYLVQEGDQILLADSVQSDDIRGLHEKMPIAENLFIDIVAENTDFLVINKSAGVVVQPAPGNWTGTLTNALLYHYPELQLLPRCGIVHRLDKDTTGLLVVARSEIGYKSLTNQVKNREMHRQYLAICRGKLVASEVIDAPIDRHPTDRRKFMVQLGGRPSVTHVFKLEEFRSHSLVRCELDTGRTHQIRVHMAQLKHPLLGDILYGGWQGALAGASFELNQQVARFKRQALHSARLAFVAPHSAKLLQYKVSLPEDMRSMYELLRADYIEKDA